MSPQGPYTQIISDEIFTDRQEFLDRWFERILGTPRLTMTSRAIIGRRRMGKTEVFLRLFNRLFWEQEEVTPVYVNLEHMPRTGDAFALEYFANFLRHYFAFRRKDEHRRILRLKWKELLPLVESAGLPGLREVTARVDSLRDSPYDLTRVAMAGARDVSDLDRTPIVFLVDEFQLLLDVDTTDAGTLDMRGVFKPGVEGLLCPVLVTGSAVTIFTREILGQGPLFLRFKVERFGGLESYYAIELAERAARPYGLRVAPEVAAELARRTDGNPFYIKAVVDQAGEQGWHLDDPETLARATAVDVTQGAIFSDVSEWVMHTLFQANQRGLAREVLLTMAERQGEPFTAQDARRVAREQGVSEEEVYLALRHLARADIIESLDVLGLTYGVIKDPLLRDYLEGLVRVSRFEDTWARVQQELFYKYRRLLGSYSDTVGLLGEAYLELLMRRFDGREVDGKYFGVERPVRLPRFAVDVLTRQKFGGAEIDLVGVTGSAEWWCVESKNRRRPVGVGEVEHFLAACRAARDAWPGDEEPVKWYFSRGGFTDEAESRLRDHDVLFTDGERLDELLRLFGLRPLPPLKE